MHSRRIQSKILVTHACCLFIDILKRSGQVHLTFHSTGDLDPLRSRNRCSKYGHFDSLPLRRVSSPYIHLHHEYRAGCAMG